MKGRDTFDRFIKYNIGELEAADRDPLQSEPLNVVSPRCAEKIIGIFNDLRDQHQRGLLRFGLCHGDVSLRNCLVQLEPRGEAPATGSQITSATGLMPRTSLIDWGCATIDVVPHAEFNAADVSPISLDSFLLGYDIIDTCHTLTCNNHTNHI